jgi:hypothetical protein
MRITTTWSFRKVHLNDYTSEDFETSWDYFIYLHVNPHVQWGHLLGTIAGLALFPWAMYRFFWFWEIWPSVVYTFFYYGVGFISHWSGDGQVSGTWRRLGQTYYHALIMNRKVLFGTFKKDVAGFFIRYPNVKWMYFKEFAPPEEFVPAPPRGTPSQPTEPRL